MHVGVSGRSSSAGVGERECIPCLPKPLPSQTHSYLSQNHSQIFLNYQIERPVSSPISEGTGPDSLLVPKCLPAHHIAPSEGERGRGQGGRLGVIYILNPSGQTSDPLQPLIAKRTQGTPCPCLSTIESLPFVFTPQAHHVQALGHPPYHFPLHKRTNLPRCQGGQHG